VACGARILRGSDTRGQSNRSPAAFSWSVSRFSSRRWRRLGLADRVPAHTSGAGGLLPSRLSLLSRPVAAIESPAAWGCEGWARHWQRCEPWMSLKSGLDFTCAPMTCRWRQCAPAALVDRTSTRCPRRFTCASISARLTCPRTCDNGCSRAAMRASAETAFWSSRRSGSGRRPRTGPMRCRGCSNCCVMQVGKASPDARPGRRARRSEGDSTAKQRTVKSRH